MLTTLLGQWFRDRVTRRERALSDYQQRLLTGIQHSNAGRLTNAEEVYRSLLADHPDDGELLHLLGSILRQRGRHADAIEVLTRAAGVAPKVAEIHFSLGDALRAAHRYPQAIEAFHTAIALRPNFGGAVESLADLLAEFDRVDEAEHYYLAALELMPRAAGLHYNYGNLLHRLGHIGKAITCYRRALALNPDFVRAHSGLVYGMNFSSEYSLEEIYEEHLRWARCHADPLRATIRGHENVCQPGRVLRIGYVSGNFRNHAVTYFFEPVLKHHDPRSMSVYCYSDVSEPDDYTARLRACGWHWRETREYTDAELAELVRSDRIDILVDLSGHTAGHRLLMFARKPAPIQVTWNGYANTTGMAAMDYRITDYVADPPGATEHLHSEKLLRLPEVYMSFTPPTASADVPLRTRDTDMELVFGSFNAISKITPVVVATWAQLLREVPAARLLMLTVPEGRARTRLSEQFAALGIDQSRLELHGRLPFPEFVAQISRADIALDPFPFSGTTTTCQTLWMGVPVITLAGRSHVSRVGASFLSNLALVECIASDERDYVACAVRLARDRARLRQLHCNLRQRMLDSPLMNGARLTGFLEQAYRKVWEDYCATRVAASHG